MLCMLTSQQSVITLVPNIRHLRYRGPIFFGEKAKNFRALKKKNPAEAHKEGASAGRIRGKRMGQKEKAGCAEDIISGFLLF